MSPQIQELIDKIKSEGIQTAESKAKEIESQAKVNADKIIEEAKKKAEQMITSARQDILKLQESSNMALAQSSRDMILSLRKKIEEVLGKIMEHSIKDSLTADKLSTIIEHVVVGSVKDANAEVVLSEKDLKDLQDGFVVKLQEKMKDAIVFRSSQDIEKGFTISYDDGKSCFDFSDKSLAEFLSKFLNEHVGAILKEAIK